MTPPDETLPDDPREELTRPDDSRRAGRGAALGLRAGALLSERYEIVRLLGRGGMGEVYEARDRELGLAIALKTIGGGLVEGSRGLKLLKREVLLARQVSHPNVCRLHDLGRDHERSLLFATMELLEGETLGAWAAARRPLDVETALVVTRQLAAGLDAAHGAGVVHRDIKPANVLVVEAEEPHALRAVLTDFGIAQLRTFGQDGAAETEDSSGTPAYMAPEQLRGDAVGPAADVYALGVVLFEMMTGRRPFMGDDAFGGSLQKLEESAPSPAEFRPDLPEAWTATIARCLERAPDERPSSAGAVVEALEGGGPAALHEMPEPGLPRPRDSFVGRDADLEELHATLRSGVPLVSLVGLGGTGKTRLALELAHRRQADWPGGVWFCDLSEARSLDGIGSAVAQVFGVRLDKADSIEQLGNVLLARKRCLVILDNFEQVARHAGASVGRWLDRAPEAQFLVTSREVLGLQGEEAFALNPMELPDAAALFEMRAKAARRGFTPTDEERELIEELVQLLDLLPLAIEIAAARVSMLTPRKILERTSDRFRLLTKAGRRVDRQATLRATLDWSWDLLEEDERAALAQLSVFEGGFTVEAAEAVLELEDSWPVDALQSLVNKSLVRPGLKERFDLLVSVQEYAAERLDEQGTRERAQARHAAHFARFGTREAIHELRTEGGWERCRLLALELDNLVAATRRSAVGGDVAHAAGCFLAAWQVLHLQGPARSACELAELVLERPDLTPEERARCLLSAGQALGTAGEPEAARERLQECRAVALAAGDRVQVGRSHLAESHLDWLQGRLDGAREHLNRADESAREFGELGDELAVSAQSGLLCWNLGEIDAARAHCERALALSRELGDLAAEAKQVGNLGILAIETNRHSEALEHCQAAVALNRRIGHRFAEGSAMGNLGVLMGDQNRMEEAADYYSRSLSLLVQAGDRRAEGIMRGNLGMALVSTGRPEEGRAQMEEGRRIAVEVGDRLTEGVACTNLADVERDSGRLQEAKRLYDESIEIHREVGNKRFEGHALNQRGEAHAALGLLAEARSDHERAIRLLREVGDGAKLVAATCRIGLLDLRSGDPESARARLAEALELEQGLGEENPEAAVELRRLREALADR